MTSRKRKTREKQELQTSTCITWKLQNENKTSVQKWCIFSFILNYACNPIQRALTCRIVKTTKPFFNTLSLRLLDQDQVFIAPRTIINFSKTVMNKNHKIRSSRSRDVHRLSDAKEAILHFSSTQYLTSTQARALSRRFQSSHIHLFCSHLPTPHSYVLNMSSSYAVPIF